MAKTGSGKTACFLIPLFERLKRRDPTKGARALILSPTRFEDYLVLGGDSMDSQFSAIHTCPDVIVATRVDFLHLCRNGFEIECYRYVVFDEADRLFEMGFGNS
ncbi:ATP-dependent RNA helicase DDX54 [Lucilia cuprina]|nr:ATP-dependent RNA helicase DDX54 [Lucilia cuprina]